MVVRIGGERMFLWRAVDDEGELLDLLVQKRRNMAAAKELSIASSTNAEMSGLLFFEDRAATADRQHHIDSTNAQVLTGTIYLSQGYLKVDPNASVANKSAYTAIIANRLELSSGPELILNSDYGATEIGRAHV